MSCFMAVVPAGVVTSKHLFMAVVPAGAGTVKKASFYGCNSCWNYSYKASILLYGCSS